MTDQPQDAFHEAANVARGYFAQADTDEAGFASAFGYDLLHTGGGVMVAVKVAQSGPNQTHIIGVSKELTCLYLVDLGEGYSAADYFFNAEDPCLVSDNSDPQDWAPSEGERVRFVRSLERFPHFIIETGETGTIDHLATDAVWVKMDRQIPEAAEWENCAVFSSDDGWHLDHVDEDAAPFDLAVAALAYYTEPVITKAQRVAIEAQAAIYDTDDAPNCKGLESYEVAPASEWGDYPADAVAGKFQYRYDDYPDDTATGLEVTIFAADGSVLDSQDFG